MLLWNLCSFWEARSGLVQNIFLTQSQFFLLKGHILLGLFWNRNSWNDQNNSSFLGLSWLQTCQNQLTVSLWRFYSHSGMREARERTNCLAYSNYSYSNYSYSRIGPKECTLSHPNPHPRSWIIGQTSQTCYKGHLFSSFRNSSKVWHNHFANFSIWTSSQDIHSCCKNVCKISNR